MGRERERERDHLSSSLSVLPLPLPVAGCVGLGFSLEEARAPKVIFLLSLLATPPTALPPSTEHRGGKEASSPVLLLPPPHTLQEAHFSLSPSPSAASFSFTPLPLLLSLQFFSGISRGRKEALLAPSPSLLWYFLFSPTQASKQTGPWSLFPKGRRGNCWWKRVFSPLSRRASSSTKKIHCGRRERRSNSFPSSLTEEIEGQSPVACN